MTALYTASFYQPKHWVGRPYRVSRLHPRGRKVQWETLPLLYPQRQLLRAYRAGEINFDALSQQYRDNLATLYTSSEYLKRWLEEVLPHLDEVTLLCFEPAGKDCHRRVLARWLQEVQPAVMLGNLR